MEETALAAAGNSLKGRKTPLINIKGNLTSVPSIWIGAGEATGGIERRSAIVAKQSEARIIPTSRTRGLVILAPVARAIRIGTIEITMPVRAEASMSPKSIVQTATGQEISLSNVLACVSWGNTTGDIAEQVKKTDTETSPGMSDITGMFRPKA